MSVSRRVAWPLYFAVIGITLFSLGGPLQVLKSALLECGRQAFENRLWLGLAIAQIVLFLSAGLSAPLRRLYLVTQVGVLLLLVPQFVLLGTGYPATAVLIVATLAAFAAWNARGVWLLAPAARTSVTGTYPLLVISTYRSCLALVLASALLQFYLHRSGLPLSTWELATVVIGCGVLSCAWTSRAAAAWSEQLGKYRLSDLLPASLLLFPVLRAKYPDAAFDTFLYKGVLPYQYADWGTANTALLDHTALGTTFQEFMNTLLLLLARDFNPSLISTLSYLALFVSVPFAVRLADAPTGRARVVRAFTGLSFFVLSEAGIAQGTSYQEPLMVLLIALSTFPAPSWLLFIAAAIATKISAILLMPLVVLVHVSSFDKRHMTWRSVSVGLIAAGVLTWGQADHNLASTGRLLGVVDVLAKYTDRGSPAPILRREPASDDPSTYFSEPPRGGRFSNAALSVCNVFALDVLCAVEYYKNDQVDDHQAAAAGFHFLPASRASGFAVILAVALIALGVGRQSSWKIALLSGLAFLAAIWVFLGSFSQGRYFVVLSIAFPLLLLVNRRLIEEALDSASLAAPGATLLIALPALWAVSDLAVGVFTNNGWDCRRGYFDLAGSYRHDRPTRAEERFIAELGASYRELCPLATTPPVVMFDYFDRLFPPYLGVHRIQPSFTLALNERYFAVDSRRKEALPSKLLAVVYRNQAVPDRLLKSLEGSYFNCWSDAGISVLCSRELAPHGAKCVGEPQQSASRRHAMDSESAPLPGNGTCPGAVAASAPLLATVFGPTTPDGWTLIGPALGRQAGDRVTGTSKNQFTRQLVIAPGAKQVAIRLPVEESVVGAALLLDVIWYREAVEVGRTVFAAKRTDDRGRIFLVNAPVPDGADRLLLIGRPWREKDGELSMRDGELDWCN